MLMAALFNHAMVILDIILGLHRVCFIIHNSFPKFSLVNFLNKLIAHDLQNFSNKGRIPFCIIMFALINCHSCFIVLRLFLSQPFTLQFGNQDEDELL